MPGQAVPKGRPRLGKGGGVYTPKRTETYEATVRLLGQLAAGAIRWVPLTTVCVATLRIFTRDRRRMDIDNITKAVLDALNGIAYADDSRVDELHVYRSISASSPRVEIEIRRP